MLCMKRNITTNHIKQSAVTNKDGDKQADRNELENVSENYKLYLRRRIHWEF